MPRKNIVSNLGDVMYITTEGNRIVIRVNGIKLPLNADKAKELADFIFENVIPVNVKI